MKYTIEDLMKLRHVVRWAWLVWAFNADKRLIPDDFKNGNVPTPSDDEMQVLLDWWKYLDDTIIATTDPEHYIYPNKPNVK